VDNHSHLKSPSYLGVEMSEMST